MADGEFSVCQFFMDDSYDYDVRYVDSETAMQSFKDRISSVGAQVGTTRRVIITDGGDCINAEWEFGKGLTFPTAEAHNEQARGDDLFIKRD